MAGIDVKPMIKVWITVMVNFEIDELMIGVNLACWSGGSRDQNPWIYMVFHFAVCHANVFCAPLKFKPVFGSVCSVYNKTFDVKIFALANQNPKKGIICQWFNNDGIAGIGGHRNTVTPRGSARDWNLRGSNGFGISACFNEKGIPSGQLSHSLVNGSEWLGVRPRVWIISVGGHIISRCVCSVARK